MEINSIEMTIIFAHESLHQIQPIEETNSVVKGIHQSYCQINSSSACSNSILGNAVATNNGVWHIS